MNEILQKRIEVAAEQYAERRFNTRLLYDMYGRQSKSDFLNGVIFAMQNQWISVEEALPKCDKCHLAMYEDGGIIVAKYENETWWWQDGFVVGRNTEGDLMFSSSCKVPSGLITHWMPIPSLGGGEK